MHDFHLQQLSKPSLTITPKGLIKYGMPYIHHSPTVKPKAKGLKDAQPNSRLKPNKSSFNEDQNGLSQEQLEMSGATIQKISLDKTNTNIFNNFYNPTPISREREKSSFMAMFKLRETQKEGMKSSLMGSPVKKQLKNATLQRGGKYNSEKPSVFEVFGTKSHRKSELDTRLNNTSQWQTHRQKSNGKIDYESNLNKSGVNDNSSRKYSPDISADKNKSKVYLNYSGGYPKNPGHFSRKIYKLAEGEQESQLMASSLDPSKYSPFRLGDSSLKLLESSQFDGNREYKSTQKQQEDSVFQVQGKGDEPKIMGGNNKLYKRGHSIDQVSQSMVEKPQHSRRDQGRNSSCEEKQGAPSESKDKKRMSLQKREIIQLQKQPEYQYHPQYLQMQFPGGQVGGAPEAEVIIINNEQDQIKYFEKFLHVDKVTFEFEKQMINRRYQMQNSRNTPVSTSTATTTTKRSIHIRTRSVEEVGSLVQTKSSPRWIQTKRSGSGENQIVGNESGMGEVNENKDSAGGN